MTVEMLSQRHGRRHRNDLAGAEQASTRHRKLKEAVAQPVVKANGSRVE